jgi:hypothetical protein
MEQYCRALGFALSGSACALIDLLLRLVVLGNSIYERTAADHPVFRSSTPDCEILMGTALSAQTRHRRRNVVVSLPSPGSARLVPEKRTSDESPIKNFMTVTQLDTGVKFKPRAVRTDDAVHPILGSRRSARLPGLGRGVTRACPSASSDACGSDGSSPRIFGGGQTSRLH